MAQDSDRHDPAYALPVANDKMELQIKTDSVDAWAEALRGVCPTEGPVDRTKETKKIARIMMQMVRRINGEELSALDEHRPDRIQVTCVTCHRGATKPQMLEDVLADVIAEDGVEAAIARYHELRERYEDGFTYNFRESTLNGLGYRLLRADQVDDAIALFKLNIEMYPEAWNPYDSLAEAYMTKGQNEQAIALYRQSLVLNPDNQNAVQMLQKLKGEAASNE